MHGGRLIGKHGPNLALEVTAMAAQRADRAQLAGLGPPCDGLRVDTKRGGNLCGRQQRIYRYGLSTIHFDSPCSYRGGPRGPALRPPASEQKRDDSQAGLNG